MPVRLVWGLSRTRKAARLAVYEATMIIANPAHTMPSTRAEKLRGVPSPIPGNTSVISGHNLLSDGDPFWWGIIRAGCQREKK